MKYMLEAGLRPSDAIHLGAMLSRGISVIVSEDGDFDRVSGVESVWL